MKAYLLETFRFNDEANKKMIEKIKTLTMQEDAVRHMSHLINSQDKWMARISMYPQKPYMDWWLPVYPLDSLAHEWRRSVNAWIQYLEKVDEAALHEDAHFIGYDDKHWSTPLKDIALQLNYHSIHHRAQVQLFIRNQGVEPDFIDYIGTKYTKHEH
ncbi:MAG: DinB family protein [Bacteroidia bacterium]|nr:DinB family protein [Bacteroidia bacterium]